VTPRYNRARLITADDRHYRQFLERIMLSKENQRASRPPRQRDLFGYEAEQALRGWLGERWPLSERRILEYEERRGRSWSRKYREIDAVSIEGTAIHVFEIKASRTAGALLRGVQQLSETRQILALLFRPVLATVLLVDTGIPTEEDIRALMAGPDAPEHPPLTVEQALALRPGVYLAASAAEVRPEPDLTNLLRFTVQDVIDLAGAENLHLNWAADEAEEPEVVESAPVVEATEPEQPAEAGEEEESPFAAAMRKAMQRREPGD
jgi:hypothetical protein